MTAWIVTRAQLNKGAAFFSLSVLGYFIVLGPVLTPSMVVASMTYFSLCMGLLLRTQSARAHVMLMSAGIAGDLLLVLILQVSRHAVQTALAFTLTPLQQAHVAASTVAVVLYFPVVYFGYGLWTSKGSNAIAMRRRHRPFAIMAFLFRSAGFLLMFSMLNK